MCAGVVLLFFKNTLNTKGRRIFWSLIAALQCICIVACCIAFALFRDPIFLVFCGINVLGLPLSIFNRATDIVFKDGKNKKGTSIK